MKSTIATALCMGMVTANFFSNLGQRFRIPGFQQRQPVPQQPQPATPPQLNSFQMYNCLARQCRPEYYVGTWKVQVADPNILQSSQCERLLYTVGPDQRGAISIAETCGNELLFATGTPKDKFTYTVPVTKDNKVTQFLKVHRIWTLNGQIVAAAVQHPLITTFRYNKKVKFPGVVSLWIKGLGLDLKEDDKVAMLAYIKRIGL